MYSILVGEIGIDRHEFLYELHLWEIRSILSGYRRRDRVQWETTRWQTWCILNALGAKIHSLAELLPLPWEDEFVGAPSQDDLNELRAKMRAEIAAAQATDNK